MSAGNRALAERLCPNCQRFTRRRFTMRVDSGMRSVGWICVDCETVTFDHKVEPAKDRLGRSLADRMPTEPIHVLYLLIGTL